MTFLPLASRIMLLNPCKRVCKVTLPSRVGASASPQGTPNLARRDLRRRERADFIRGNVIDDHLGVMPLAPFPGELLLEPAVELGQEMRPFGDLERLLLGERALGK